MANADEVLQAANAGTLVGGPQRYRKRPVVIEALQLTWPNWQAMCEFAGVGEGDDMPLGGVLIAVDDDGKKHYSWGTDAKPSDGTPLALRIPTLEGVMVGDENDWIIRGVQGELYPCKPDIFEATYEPE